MALAETNLLTAQLLLSARLNSQSSVTMETAVSQVKAALLTLDALSVLRDALMDHVLEPPIHAVRQLHALHRLHTNALI
jgi:hypothetical protein